jgi:hypothetical protein
MITILSLMTIMHLRIETSTKKPASLNATIMNTWHGSSD